MEKRVIVLTGAPGVGKTTILMNTINALRAQGLRIGGMVSREACEGNNRVGFEIRDVLTDRHGWLAHINQKNGPQVGKYRVNLNDLNNIGAQAINEATKTCSIVAIDEIGPMELFSEKFKEATKEALASDKLIIAIVHSKSRDKLAEETKNRGDAEIFIVTHENRDKLYEVITANAKKFLKKEL